MKNLLNAVRAVLDSNKWLLLVVVIAAEMLNTLLEQRLIFRDELYFSTYGEQMPYEAIAEFVEWKDKVSWMAYIFGPLTILIRIPLIALVLNIGVLLAGLKIPVKRVFGVVLVGEIVFVIYSILTTLTLRFVLDIDNLNDITTFTNFSALALFGAENVPQVLRYPLQTINIFEILYWFVLAFGISHISAPENKPELALSYKRSFKLVMSSYGTGLLVWMVIVVFMMVTFL